MTPKKKLTAAAAAAAAAVTAAATVQRVSIKTRTHHPGIYMFLVGLETLIVAL